LLSKHKLTKTYTFRLNILHLIKKYYPIPYDQKLNIWNRVIFCFFYFLSFEYLHESSFPHDLHESSFPHDLHESSFPHETSSLGEYPAAVRPSMSSPFRAELSGRKATFNESVSDGRIARGEALLNESLRTSPGETSNDNNFKMIFYKICFFGLYKEQNGL